MRDSPANQRHVAQIIALIALVVSQSCSRGGEDVELDIGTHERAKSLISEVAETYRRMGSYRDRGSVTQYKSDGVTVLWRFEFKTAFVRPNQFRFEWNKPSASFDQGQSVVWSNGTETSTWHKTLRTKERSTVDLGLDLAVAGATGVSNGAAHTIPALLMPGTISGNTLRDLARPRIESEGVERDRSVWVVMGYFADRYPTRVFVDKASLAVLRIDKLHENDHSKAVRVTTYEPEIGAQVSEEELELGWD